MARKAYMVCEACGHEYKDHRSVTQSMYFCSKCQKVEPFVSFTENLKQREEAASSSTPNVGNTLARYFESA
jgi:hypothetical protein